MKSRLAGSALFLVAALGGTVLAAPGCRAGTGSESTGVGDPCLPLMENDATFRGFEDQIGRAHV